MRINGDTHYFWRAVDHEGEVLEVFAIKRRDIKAALEFQKRTMKRYGRPQVVATDRLRSYRVAMNVIGNGADQERGRWLDNPVENTSQSFRRRKGAMSKFRDIKTFWKFASVYASTHDLRVDPRPLQFRRSALSTHATFRQNRPATSAEWCQIAA